MPTRTPAAAWIGLSLRHGRSHLVRSVMEGATYAMRDCLEIINGMNIPVKEIRLSGGGARSAFWRQMQADIYGQQVCTINAEEGPAYGVALLAAAGTGRLQERRRSLQGDDPRGERDPSRSRTTVGLQQVLPAVRGTVPVVERQLRGDRESDCDVTTARLAAHLKCAA